MDPKELNFQLAHLGINQADAEEGAATAALLSSLFGWEVRETPGSIFVNEQFEVMIDGYLFKILSVHNKMIQSVLVTKKRNDKKDEGV
jgi:2-dehydro-3-deoxyphosphogluconate aldolase/(4S)-4-hydroxy-2-oxoglutarate aldolase